LSGSIGRKKHQNPPFSAKDYSRFNKDGEKVRTQNKTFLLLGNSRDIKPDW
jgi:hypothetical protein